MKAERLSIVKLLWLRDRLRKLLDEINVEFETNQSELMRRVTEEDLEDAKSRDRIEGMRFLRTKYLLSFSIHQIYFNYFRTSAFRKMDYPGQ